jgi:hypothetical protein
MNNKTKMKKKKKKQEAFLKGTVFRPGALELVIFFLGVSFTSVHYQLPSSAHVFSSIVSS